jgi:hypothetical protein
MTESFGTTQVKEHILTRDDLEQIVKENMKARCNPSYDFDADNPIFLWHPNGYLVIRYVQKEITREFEHRRCMIGPIPKSK